MRNTSARIREGLVSFPGNRPGSEVGPPYPGGGGFTLTRRRHTSADRPRYAKASSGASTARAVIGRINLLDGIVSVRAFLSAGDHTF